MKIARFLLAGAVIAASITLAANWGREDFVEHPTDTATAKKTGVTDEATIKFQADDGVTLYGEHYTGGLDASAPLVLLFHQGGSNGRGEYGPIIPSLNQAGFRAIAFDQRSGGNTYGETNRTVDTIEEGSVSDYCAVYNDLEAALHTVIANEQIDKVVLWGSSYSGSLVFQLAAKNPEAVSGVIAFSPASGGPLANCRAGLWADNVAAPMFVLRPASEMERPSSVDQRATLEAAGADFWVVEHGVHGSSMLVDERTGEDMSAARDRVLNWLKGL